MITQRTSDANKQARFDVLRMRVVGRLFRVVNVIWHNEGASSGSLRIFASEPQNRVRVSSVES